MTHPQTQDDEALVEVMARAIFCELDGVDPAFNEALLGCYFKPFNEHPDDESRVLMDEYRHAATAALTALRNHEGRKG